MHALSQRGKVNDTGGRAVPRFGSCEKKPFPGARNSDGIRWPNRMGQLQFVFDMCELQVHHLQLLACERTRRSEKERARQTRKARTRHRRMRLPLSQINVHLCLSSTGEKKREREKVYDRFDDPCQVDRESVTGASQQGRRTPTTTTTRKPPFSLPILPFRFDGPWTPLITVNFEQIHWIDWLPVILDFLTRWKFFAWILFLL